VDAKASLTLHPRYKQMDEQFLAQAEEDWELRWAEKEAQIAKRKERAKMVREAMAKAAAEKKVTYCHSFFLLLILLSFSCHHYCKWLLLMLIMTTNTHVGTIGSCSCSSRREASRGTKEDETAQRRSLGWRSCTKEEINYYHISYHTSIITIIIINNTIAAYGHGVCYTTITMILTLIIAIMMIASQRILNIMECHASHTTTFWQW
jgi:hypothetical protein